MKENGEVFSDPPKIKKTIAKWKTSCWGLKDKGERLSLKVEQRTRDGRYKRNYKTLRGNYHINNSKIFPEMNNMHFQTKWDQ